MNWYLCSQSFLYSLPWFTGLIYKKQPSYCGQVLQDNSRGFIYDFHLGGGSSRITPGLTATARGGCGIRVFEGPEIPNNDSLEAIVDNFGKNKKPVHCRLHILLHARGTILPPSNWIFPCIVRPKRNAIIDLLYYDSNWVGKNGRGGEKEKEKERRKREKKVRAEVAGEDQTRAPSLVKTAL